jgi:hypothetical protein
MRYRFSTDVIPAVFTRSNLEPAIVPGDLTVLQNGNDIESTKWTSNKAEGWVWSSGRQPPGWLLPLPTPGELTSSISLGPTTHSAPMVWSSSHGLELGALLLLLLLSIKEEVLKLRDRRQSICHQKIHQKHCIHTQNRNLRVFDFCLKIGHFVIFAKFRCYGPGRIADLPDHFRKILWPSLHSE